MKTLIALVLFSTPSMAQELPLSSKQMILNAIASDVFFEDEGYVRAPQAIEDFTFTQTDTSLFTVTGDSYSDWDMKKISYACSVEVLTRGMIKTENDIAVTCDVTGENWPYINSAK